MSLVDTTMGLYCTECTQYVDNPHVCPAESMAALEAIGLMERAEQAEAEVKRLRRLLKRARPHVQQAGDGGLVPAREAVAQDKLLSDIDKALKGTGC